MPQRTFDVIFSVTLLVSFAIPILLIFLLIRITSQGPAIYWSDRIGKNNRIFRMPKFRTMQVGTPAVATHLIRDSDLCITPLGRFLRKTSLDELPQFWSILNGEMTVVGPRPALFNQDDLIDLRSSAGVDKLTPGLTGWAQINGRDNLTVAKKVKLDREYMQRRSFLFDMKIIILTLIKIFKNNEIYH